MPAIGPKNPIAGRSSLEVDMAEPELKRPRFKKLRETLESAEQQEKVKTEKARICDRMMEIYRNKDLDFGKKSELFIQVLATASDGQ